MAEMRRRLTFWVLTAACVSASLFVDDARQQASPLDFEDPEVLAVEEADLIADRGLMVGLAVGRARNYIRAASALQARLLSQLSHQGDKGMRQQLFSLGWKVAMNSQAAVTLARSVEQQGPSSSLECVAAVWGDAALIHLELSTLPDQFLDSSQLAHYCKMACRNARVCLQMRNRLVELLEPAVSTLSDLAKVLLDGLDQSDEHGEHTDGADVPTHHVLQHSLPDAQNGGVRSTQQHVLWPTRVMTATLSMDAREVEQISETVRLKYMEIRDDVGREASATKINSTAVSPPRYGRGLSFIATRRILLFKRRYEHWRQNT